MTEELHKDPTVPAAVPGGLLPVRKIKHGEIITEPGVYDMPMGWYHDNCCDGPSISSSGLRTIIQKSPLHYWYNSPLNPDRAEEDDDEESTYMRVGKAAHTLLLEPDLFRSMFVTRPGCWADWRTNAAKTWRAEKIAEGFTVLSPAEMEQIIGIHDALKKHPLYREGLLEGDIERALIWRDSKTGVWLKARPDALPRGSTILSDVKVTTDCRDDKITRKIFDMGYDMQLALGGIGMKRVLNRDIDEFVIVAVESKKPHGIRIAAIDHDEIYRATCLLRKALDDFAECYRTGEWPSFERDDSRRVFRRKWDAEMIDLDISNGTIPKGDFT